METFKSREQLAMELGLSYSTFRRKIKEKALVIPKGLLSPDDQMAIKKLLGCSSERISSLPSNKVSKNEQL